MSRTGKTHSALLAAPPEIIEYIERLAADGVVITGVEYGCLAVEFDSAPFDLVAEMTDITAL